MHITNRFALSVLLTLAIGILPSANTDAADVTGLFVVEGARSSMNSVIEKAREEGQMLLVDAAVQVNGMIDRVERILGKSITKPLQNLDATMQNEVSALRFMVEAVRQTAQQLPRCVGQEAELAIANLKSGVSTAMSNLPLIEGGPIAYLVQQPSTRSLYAVTRERDAAKAVPVLIRGANLWSGADVCHIQAEAIPLSVSGAVLTTWVVATDQEKIQLTLPGDISDGEWNLRVRASVKSKWFGCLIAREETVNASFKVQSPLTASVEVQLTPVCSGYDPCEEKVSGSCTNGSARDDKNCTHTFQFKQSKDCEFGVPPV